MNTIEETLDKISNEAFGDEMTALIALKARNYITKLNRFITEFATSIQQKNPLTVAMKVLKYMYPENKAAWEVWDEVYMEIVKDSAWLTANTK